MGTKVVTGTGTPGFMGNDGPATMAELNAPADVEVGPDGTLYIADTENSCIRSVDSAGVIHPVVGQCGRRGTTGDGMSPTDALTTPSMRNLCSSSIAAWTPPNCTKSWGSTIPSTSIRPFVFVR